MIPASGPGGTPDSSLSAPLLQVRGLNAYYGRAHILSDVDLDVASGEVVALLGRNGAGKSTTFKALMGLLPGGSGTVRFAAAAIEGETSYRIARRGLGYVPEDRRVFASLTVLENLEVGRQPPRPGVPHWTPERLFDLFPNLGRMRHRPGAAMSGGEQQMLTIARTLMGNPRLILLDEPSEGLSPKIVEDMALTIRALKADGLTVMLSEQNLHFATAIADRAYIIEKGRIRYQGAMAELAADSAVQAAYLSA